MRYTDIVFFGFHKSVEYLIDELLASDFFKGRITILDKGDNVGRYLSIADNKFVIQDIEQADISRFQLAVFATTHELANQYIKSFIEHDVKVIDATGSLMDCGQYHSRVILPNDCDDSNVLRDYLSYDVLLLPTTTALQLISLLQPLQELLHKVVATSYHSVSDTGFNGMNELLSQVTKLLNYQPLDDQDAIFSKQLAFNVIPYVKNYHLPEEKMVDWYLQQFNINNVILNCVRVPIFAGTGLLLNCEFNTVLTTDKIKEVFSNQKDVVIVDYDDIYDEHGSFITPFEILGEQQLYVSQIRQHASNVISMWSVADNIQYGFVAQLLKLIRLFSSY